MKFGFGRVKEDVHLEFLQSKDQTGLSIDYQEHGGTATVSLLGGSQPVDISFPATATDEAHILYMQSSEVLRSKAAAGENREAIAEILRKLFASYKR